MEWWKKNFLVAEFWLAVLTTFFFAFWSEYLGGAVIVSDLLKDNRSELYSTLAAIFGALLGFVITSASIVLGYTESKKLSLVTGSSYYPQLWEVFTSNIRVLGAATILSLYGLITDTNNLIVNYVIYANFGIVLLAIFRLARAIWVFENIVWIVTKPKPKQ